MSVSIGGGGAAASGLTAASLLPSSYTDAVEAYKKIQQELGTLVSKQTASRSQLNENAQVKEVRRAVR